MPDRLQANLLRRRSGLADVRVYASLRSTQTRAAELIEQQNLNLPAAILASRQTAGRGQASNTWWSGPGSLTVTFAFPADGLPIATDPPLPKSQIPNPKSQISASSSPKSEIKNQKLEISPTLPLRAGLALRTAISRHLDPERLRIKWPNDLLADGRKLAGILCERVRNVDLIGIGINVSTDLSHAPEEVRHRATSILDLAGKAPPRSEVFIDIAIALREALISPESSPALNWHEELNRAHALNGRSIAVDRGEGEPLRGTCTGVDAEGRLLMREGTTLHRILSGRVVEW